MGSIRCPYCQEMIPDDFAHCGFCGKDVQVKNEKYMLQIGTVLQDRYYIGAAIGQGGFGITYSCCDLRLDMKVAIKEYYPDRLVTRDTSVSDNIVLINQSKKSVYDHEKDKCLLEARTLGDFADNPGVVRASDIFNQNDTVYIVMEYLEGMTLEQFRKRNPDVDFEFCYKMLSPVISVLERIHERGLIHRDISPSNIMVLPDGRAKLLDFGSASRYDSSSDDEILVLREGYSPIEQYQKGVKTGPWTDVYSFCATFYYMLTGVNPVSANERTGNDKLERPSKLGAVILGGQEDALMHGLVLNPKYRTRSMKQLEDEMELRVPVIKPEQFIDPEDGIKLNVLDGISGMVSLNPDLANKKEDTIKKGKRKKLIALIAAAVFLIVCLSSALLYTSHKPRITTAYLIEEVNQDLAQEEKVKLTIKTNVNYRKYYTYTTSYPSAYSNDETVEVWSGQDDCLYVKNTSSIGYGYVAYMIMDHLKGNTYKLGKNKSSSFELDNNYASYIIPMLLKASVLNETMQIAEDKTKIDGSYCYKMSTQMSVSSVLSVLDELNIYEDIPQKFINSYGLVPKAVVTAYISTEDHSLKRISITMSDFDDDALTQAYNKYTGEEEYALDNMSVTMNIDYAYGEKAQISENEAGKFTDIKSRIEADDSVTWAYEWGKIWSFNIFY